MKKHNEEHRNLHSSPLYHLDNQITEGKVGGSSCTRAWRDTTN